MNEEFPYLDLFYQLREAGLNLGIDQYRLLLQAFRLGYGVGDAEALRKVCHAIWTKSRQEQQLFDFQFKRYQALHQPAAPVEVPTSAESAQPATDAADAAAGAEPAAPVSPGPAQPSPTMVTQPQAGEDSSRTPAVVSSAAALPVVSFTQVIGDEMQTAHLVQVSLDSGAGFEARSFVLTGEYFPVTLRQMKQNWRYLRRMVREGPKTEVNVEETARQVGSQGFLLEPVLEARRLNRTELVLLIDQKGSMVPFHILARRLVETAQKGGKLGRTGVFFFHDCPGEFLFTDPALVNGRSVQSTLAQLQGDRAVVLVFSDAGAARGKLDFARIETTRLFLQQARQSVRRISWLNPMPASRWVGTSAAEISRQVPMFEFTRRGMDAAIDILRGRYLPTGSRFL